MKIGEDIYGHRSGFTNGGKFREKKDDMCVAAQVVIQPTFRIKMFGIEQGKGRLSGS